MTDLITDEMLTAYLDGELEGEELEKVEAALKTDAGLAVRLAALDIPLGNIKSGFDDVLEVAPPVPDLPTAQSPSRSFAPMAMAASLALGIAIGALWMGSNSADDAVDWKMAVANYQVLYVPETLSVPAPSEEQSAEKLAALSSALGRDLSDAIVASDLEFRRAQMLGLNGAPLVQMAYVSVDGQPFAICVTEVNEADYAPQSEVLAGLASAHWTSDGFGFLVIGGDDLSYVQLIAEDLSDRI